MESFISRPIDVRNSKADRIVEHRHLESLSFWYSKVTVELLHTKDVVCGYRFPTEDMLSMMEIIMILKPGKVHHVFWRGKIDLTIKNQR